MYLKPSCVYKFGVVSHKEFEIVRNVSGHTEKIFKHPEYGLKRISPPDQVPLHILKHKDCSRVHYSTMTRPLVWHSLWPYLENTRSGMDEDEVGSVDGESRVRPVWIIE